MSELNLGTVAIAFVEIEISHDTLLKNENSISGGSFEGKIENRTSPRKLTQIGLPTVTNHISFAARAIEPAVYATIARIRALN